VLAEQEPAFSTAVWGTFWYILTVLAVPLVALYPRGGFENHACPNITKEFAQSAGTSGCIPMMCSTGTAWYPRRTLGLQKSGSALKERQISAHAEPAIEREIEIAIQGQKRSPGRESHGLSIRAIRSSTPPLSEDGLSSEIVFQHFAEAATLCGL
jgi:hypothetical protein